MKRRTIMPCTLLLLTAFDLGCGGGGSGGDDSGTRPLQHLSTCVVDIPGYYHVAALLPYEGAWPVGEHTSRALIQAVEEINAGGGISGSRLGLVLCNTKGDAVHAARVMREVAAEPGVVAVVGPMRSGPTQAAAAVAEQEHLLLVTPGPGPRTSELTTRHHWAASTAAPPELLGRVTSAMVQRRQIKRVFVLNIDDPHANAYREAFADDFREAGWPSSHEVYRDSDPQFATNAVQAARAYGPQ
jgi:branched-chain amino acid transport system substrate-binding protein